MATYRLKDFIENEMLEYMTTGKESKLKSYVNGILHDVPKKSRPPFIDLCVDKELYGKDSDKYIEVDGFKYPLCLFVKVSNSNPSGYKPKPQKKTRTATPIKVQEKPKKTETKKTFTRTGTYSIF